MWIELLPVIFSGGGLLAGIGALIAVFLNRKSSKETIKIDHSQIVLEGYNELVAAVQAQVDKLNSKISNQDEKMETMSITIDRQDNEIRQLRVELRDRDDKIRMLTLDRDDLVALVTGPRPNLRTL
jgi:tRNA/tmRNA/rRNA uracil-C5-methylase (TrmA/RlmC/RlmD family)